MKTRPNILFLMTDQHRIDHVSYAGTGRLATPNLDRIAESVGFTGCATVNPICTPARTALMTGKYTHQIGTLSMSGDLSLQHPTYPRALQRAGYRTVGIGKFHFLQTWRWGTERGQGVDLLGIEETMKGYGFDEVWETSGKQLSCQNYCAYCRYLEERGELERYRDFVDAAGPNTDFLDKAADDAADGDPSPVPETDHVDYVTCDRILAAIRARPADAPLFVFGSFCSPHKPMDPPERYLDLFPPETDAELLSGPAALIPGDKPFTAQDLDRMRKKRRAYKAQVAFIDDQIGRIFACLESEGALNDTVILFTSDHGDMLGDHGRIQKSTWHEQALIVPTAIRHPDHLRAARCSAPIEITDLSATILDIAGIDPSDALSKQWPAFHDRVPCRSLMPIVRGDAESVRDFSFSECGGSVGDHSGRDWQTVRDGRWKYVRHLRYAAPGAMKEELYDLRADPSETRNLIAATAGAAASGATSAVAPADALPAEAAAVLALMRERRDWVLDSTPPAQLRWAPLPPEGERFSYPDAEAAFDPGRP